MLSAIFYVVRLIAATQGIKPEWIEENAGNVNSVRPQKYVQPTPEEIEAREAAETRRQFAPILAKAKAAMANGQTTFRR